MEFPDLLFAEKQNISPFDAVLFENLKQNELLAAFFSEPERDEIVQVLKCPCTAENIRHRRELVFTLLEDAAVLDTVRKLQTALFTLSRSEKMYASAGSAAEKYAAFFMLVRDYLGFIDAAAKTPRKCFLLNRFADYFAEISASDRAEQARREMKFAGEEFLGLKPVKLTPASRMGVSFAEDADITVNEKLRRISESLGIACGENAADERHRPSANMMAALFSLCADYSDALYRLHNGFESFYNPGILGYIRQLRFLLNIESLLERLREKGIPLSAAVISNKREIVVYGGCDPALILKDGVIVRNDVRLDENERFAFLLGANGGGKTTYIRMVGAVTLFFLAGLPVPCESARLYPSTKILTHFPVAENFVGEGRLQNELKRLKEILDKSDGETLVLLNETFSGTTEEKAVALTAKAAGDFLEKNSIGIFVTHQRGVCEKCAAVRGLSFLETAPEERFKIREMTDMPGTGMAEILKKYGLTRAQLEERAGKAI